MNTEMVAPSRLHRSLERATNATAEERKIALGEVLSSKNLAVIRRIPELLSPLSDEEKEMVAQWAESMTGGEDVSDRDFGFHLMANCKVSAERILGILEQNKTFSRSALEHIQQVLGVGEPIQQLNTYLYEVAETLLKSEEIRPRDRGRHMLMTLARTRDDWFNLARRFSEKEIGDLRQRVIERFLNECSDQAALTLFINRVDMFCLGCIELAERHEVHKEASHMHWVLMCLEVALDKEEHLRNFVALLERKFGMRTLPHSVRWKIESMLPRPTDRAAQQSSPPVLKKVYSETNAQVAARLGISKRQVAKMRANGEIS
jgi:hypothetical protein